MNLSNKEKYKELIHNTNRMSQQDLFQYVSKNYPTYTEEVLNYKNLNVFFVAVIKKLFRLAYPTDQDYLIDKDIIKEK